MEPTGDGDGDGNGEAEKSSPPPPAGLTPIEYSTLRPVIDSHHRLDLRFDGVRRCASLLVQRTPASPDAVWSVVRRFDRPQIYKHFVRSCSLRDPPADGQIRVGSIREVSVISGLPANTSAERLDVLDDENRVFGFSIIGGEHRMRNYRSVTTVNEVRDEETGKIWTVVLESYVVDVPEGNTEDDTRLFADTVVRLNLQKLAAVAESAAKST